ncbi:MAG TPA: hypothetical protein V6C58_04270 [Allocoleopsis sp.]
MTHTTDLNAMTIAQLKEFYSTLSNPISVIGTGKNGYKSKKDWIDAIEKSLISVNDGDQSVTEEVIADDEIPFYGEGTEPYWEDLEELGKFREERYQPEREIFGVPISFGWTADRLLAGIKSVTRRTWKIKYAQMFINAYEQGKLIQAFDKGRQYGGKLIGYLKISDIYRESIFDISKSDVELEGFPELSKEEFIERFFPDMEVYQGGLVWVIRFDFVGLTSHPEILERHGFKLSGDVKNCWFLSRYSEIKEELNGWKIILTPGFKRTSSGNIFFQKIDLINIDSGEMWSKDVTGTPISKKCLSIARKAILDIAYNLNSPSNPTIAKTRKYESQKIRHQGIK